MLIIRTLWRRVNIDQSPFLLSLFPNEKLLLNYYTEAICIIMEKYLDLLIHGLKMHFCFSLFVNLDPDPAHDPDNRQAITVW